MPAAPAPITAADDYFRDEPFVSWFRIFSIEKVRVNSPALPGATTLSVDSLRRPLNASYRVYFPATGFSVKLTSPAVIGATTLAVSPIAGPLPVGAEGTRQLDAGALTLRWTLELKQPQAISPVVLTKTPTTVADPADQDGSPYTLAVVTKLAADLATSDPGTYVQRLVRSDTGRCLAQGDVVVKIR